MHTVYVCVCFRGGGKEHMVPPSLSVAVQNLRKLLITTAPTSSTAAHRCLCSLTHTATHSHEMIARGPFLSV